MKVDDLLYMRHLWAYDWRLQSERTPQAIADRMVEYGFGALQQEVLYKRTWQGQIDGLSPASLEQTTALRDYLASRGLVLVPVVVPGTLADVDLHASVARACGCLVVDLEWDRSDPSYWTGTGPQIPQYAARLRELAPSAVLGWQPDGRIADSGRATEWQLLAVEVAPSVDAFWPQLYAGWTPYGTGEAAVQADVRRWQAFATLDKPVCPTLYTEVLWESSENWRRMEAEGALALSAFRLGAMDGAALSNVAAMPLPPKPVPPEPPEPAPCPPMNDEWTLRIGLGQLLAGGTTDVLNDTLTAAEACTAAREAAEQVIAAVDAAGGQ